MAASGSVRAEDLQKALRLLREMGELPAGTGEREQHFLRGARDLFGCPFALFFHVDDFILGKLPLKSLVTYEVGLESFQHRLLIDYITQVGLDDPIFAPLALHLADLRPGEVLSVRRLDVIPDQVWYRNDHVHLFRKPFDCERSLFGNLKLDDQGRVAILSLQRPWGEPPFGERERALVELVFPEAVRLLPLDSLALGGVQRDPKTGLVRVVRSLPPRLRLVLDHLLHGRAVGEIAHTLHLSPHTIREHVQRLLRTFGVSSQLELLALCTGRLPESPPLGPDPP